MFSHLEDPYPPEASPRLVERVVAGARRRRARRRAAFSGLLAGATVAAAVGGFLLVEENDGRKIGTVDAPATSIHPSLTTSPETAQTTGEPAPAQGSDVVLDPANTFAAITEDGAVVIADAATGRVLRILVEAPETRDRGAWPPSVSRTADGRAVYYTTPGDSRCSLDVAGEVVGGGQAWRVSSVGEPPEQVATADQIAVSPDGSGLAYSCRNRVTVRQVDSGVEPFFEILWSGDADVRELAWSPDGATLLVGAGGPEAPTEVSVVDAGDWSVRLLGPPEDAEVGTGWYSPEVRESDGLVGLVRHCCSRDANSYDGGYAFAVVAPNSGRVIDTAELPAFGAVEYDLTGDHQLLLVVPYDGQTTALYRRDASGPFVAIEEADRFQAIDW